MHSAAFPQFGKSSRTPGKIRLKKLLPVLLLAPLLHADGQATAGIRGEVAATLQAQNASPATPRTTPQAVLRGTVADPDDAMIPGATVTLTPASGRAYTTTTGSDGTYTLRGVPAGTYSLTVTMPGFAAFVRQVVRITGQPLTVNAKLAIQNQRTEVTVTANPNAVSVDAESNASSTIIKGKDLDALSDDPDELSSQLTALAGPSAGPDGGQIYIDGFTGGALPPKSSIREIRINQNPFSAQFDRVGYGRVEIFTKPGTDKLHGNLSVQGNDSAFNTSNPFLGSANTQPPYYSAFAFGSVTGPINKFASFSVGGSDRSIQTNTLVNPSGFYSNSPGSTTPCQPGDLTCTNLGSYPTNARAVPQPQIRWDITPRIDVALGEKNTLTVRYQYERADLTNQGIGNNVLPMAGLNSNNYESEVQISDTQLLSSKIVNETRFEYNSSGSNQTPLNPGPQLNVQGYFTAGGANSGTSIVSGSHIEVQNYSSVALRKNFIRFGGRLRSNHQNLNSTAGANGTFTYSYLLDPCIAGTPNGVKPANCNPAVTTPCQNLTANNGTYYSSYQCGFASQFNYTRINQQNIQDRYTDLGLYMEDDWKPRANLNISYGLRLETQSKIASSHDFAPRVSISYGLPHKGSATPTVLRAGFGIFYNRFGLGDILTTDRLNGTNQVQQTYNYPGAGCAPPPLGQPLTQAIIDKCSTNAAGLATAGLATTYTLAPAMRSAYILQNGLGVDQQLGRAGTISVNYIHSRGVHQYLSRSYTPSNGAAPTAYNYQYDSGGIFKQDQMIVNGRLRVSKVSLSGYYALSFANSNTNGSGSFLTSPGATATDFGRASFNRRQQGIIQGSITARYGIEIAPFLIAQSGTPYNVTTGVDNNQDSIYNDRPGFANGSSGNCFDANSFTVPSSGASVTPIPVNYCTGPAAFSFNARVNRSFGFGPLTDAARNAAQAGSRQGPGGDHHSGGPGGAGPPGGGRGPGGFGGGGGSGSGHRYNLSLGVQAFNLFNVIPYSTPVSQLTSNRFGQFLSLSNNFLYSSATAVRRISLQANFSF